MCYSWISPLNFYKGGKTMRNVLSDFCLDREKKKKCLDFFWWLRKYLMKKRNDENRLQKVLETAKAVEELEENYLPGQARLSQGLTERLAMLKLGDEREWLIFLLAMWHCYQNLGLDENKVLYQELKKFSPFKDYFILSLDYREENDFGDEVLFIEWEIKEWIKQLMAQNNLSINKKNEKLIICVPKNDPAIEIMFI
ncbi:MAG: hypothetical protein PHH56_01990 [Candidatus Pacebacteria bacterium]|nr:hypothetical protein [Candidatus Paceibacterota bacterium]